MIKLSKAIEKYFENQETNTMLFGTIDHQWKIIVGEKIFKATKVIKIENKKIFIKCKNPAWKQELQFQKKELINKIQQHTKQIKDIIII